MVDHADAHATERAEALVLRLLRREDARFAAIDGGSSRALRVALQLGDTELRRWAALGLAELSKLLVLRATEEARQRRLERRRQVPPRRDGPPEPQPARLTP